MKKLTYQEMRDQLTPEERVECMYSNYLECKYFKHLAEVRLDELKKGEISGRDYATTND